MSPYRRQVLKALGAGFGLGVLGTPAIATGSERVIVHPETGVIGDVLSAVESVGGTTLRTFDNFSFVVAEVPADRQDRLRNDLRIAFIENDGGIGIPSDWLPSVSDILDPGGPTNCDMHPEQRESWGWERIGADGVGADGSGVSVGILDTGIQSDHCSLKVDGGHNTTGGLNSGDYEDRHGHGTHVAGVAGALDNELGVVGVAPGVDLYAVKVLDDEGSGSYSSLIAGIDWCMSNDIEIISMSLGGESPSRSVDEAVDQAYEAGHLLLSAAGNEDNMGDGTCDEQNMTYPATHEKVLAVAAMDDDDTLASYSSVGSTIELLAPGTDILSTYHRNRYAEASGTSVACPFVAGVAALAWEQADDEEDINRAVRTVLQHGAEPILDTCEEGHGLVNAGTATREAPNGSETNPPNGGGQHSMRPGELSFFERIADFFARVIEWLANLLRW